jgi:hypothetical protein
LAKLEFSRCLELCLFIEWDILWQNKHITSRTGGFHENHCSGCEGYGLLFISIQGTPPKMAKGENDDNLLAFMATSDKTFQFHSPSHTGAQI